MKRLLIIVAIVAGFVAGAMVGTASASNRFPTNNRAGANSTVTFKHLNLASTMHDAAHNTDTTDVEPTDVYTLIYHTGTREVTINDYSYNSSAYGWYECHSSYLSGGVLICTNSHVHIDLYLVGAPNPPGSSYSTTEARSLMCEEVGHAIGLAHSSEGSSCMSGAWDDTDWTSHDDGVVNGIY
ncbi:MAG: hypothetical protein BMS9Abin17_0364 [Acidimicrobiia bacterium]|nr:MAG: hypothetical protein BMS9Abin17_0364 [Acidimicrobiia bacterium]